MLKKQQIDRKVDAMYAKFLQCKSNVHHYTLELIDHGVPNNSVTRHLSTCTPPQKTKQILENAIDLARKKTRENMRGSQAFYDIAWNEIVEKLSPIIDRDALKTEYVWAGYYSSGE